VRLNISYHYVIPQYNRRDVISAIAICALTFGG
jgi:hypothetical protein